MKRIERSAVLAGILLVGILTGAAPAVGSAQISQAEHASRRSALAQRVGDGVILAMGSAQPPEDYIAFYQNSPFRYLTGFTEPNAALLMTVRGGSVDGELLFVNPRDPGQETWEGYRVGPEGARMATGIRGRNIEELSAVVDSLVSAGRVPVSIAGPYNPSAGIRDDVTQRIEGLLGESGGLSVRSVGPQVSELRQVKSAAELELIRKAAEITVQAHREIMGATAPGMNEFELQSLLEYTFRRYGAERPAFSSIVGSGPNSTVLHYNANDRFMEDGDVVVADIGASYGGYAADVTRTFPVSGQFSEPQRQIYQLVRDAQAAAEAVARPGVSVSQMSGAAAGVLAQGLARLGLIEAPDATYVDERGRELPQYFLYYMHALGHGIGLDVHDPWPSVLEPGVPFTIEPGVYVRPNLFDEVLPDVPRNRGLREAAAQAFTRYAGIGVRIEDDYIVTATGVEWISRAPREIAEIEALMSEAWPGPAPRNSDWVDWYRGMP